MRYHAKKSWFQTPDYYLSRTLKETALEQSTNLSGMSPEEGSPGSLPGEPFSVGLPPISTEFIFLTHGAELQKLTDFRECGISEVPSLDCFGNQFVQLARIRSGRSDPRAHQWRRHTPWSLQSRREQHPRVPGFRQSKQTGRFYSRRNTGFPAVVSR